MSEVLFNKRLAKDLFLLGARHKNNVRPGQFYMLRAWQSYPVLSRPISVYDADSESVTFLYEVVGEGTEIFSRLKAGDELTLHGPYGNEFPEADGRIALVGGGAGIAPLYFVAKRLKAVGRGDVDMYFGSSGEPVLIQEFEQAAGRVIVDVGGFITDKIDTREYDCIMACGPDPMLLALYRKHVSQKSPATLYVSMGNRMACGFGACRVCSCATPDGNKRVCRDGPIFEGKEVFGL